MELFNEVAAAFQCPGKYLGEEPYGSGHINDSFRVVYAEEMWVSAIPAGFARFSSTMFPLRPTRATRK